MSRVRPPERWAHTACPVAFVRHWTGMDARARPTIRCSNRGVSRPRLSKTRSREPREGDLEMTVSKLAVSVLLCTLAFAWVGGCSGSSGGGDGGVGSTGGLPPGTGLCESACPLSCNVDSDCQTENGQKCCDFGSGGKVCELASDCPVFCTSDSMCQEAQGQACVQVSLAAG